VAEVTDLRTLPLKPMHMHGQCTHSVLLTFNAVGYII